MTTDYTTELDRLEDLKRNSKSFEEKLEFQQMIYEFNKMNLPGRDEAPEKPDDSPYECFGCGS